MRETRCGFGWIAMGAMLMAIGVALGAFGAHALESVVGQWYEDGQGRLENWYTAVRYHIYHSLGLILLGLFCAATERQLVWAPTMFIVGIFLFSGGLYGWVLVDFRPLVMIVPLGGIGFITGWILFAVAAWQSKFEGGKAR